MTSRLTNNLDDILGDAHPDRLVEVSYGALSGVMHAIRRVTQEHSRDLWHYHEQDAIDMLDDAYDHAQHNPNT